MVISRDKKVNILEELKKKAKNAKVIIFSQYKGLSVQNSGKIKKEIRNNGAEYKIAKKSLIKISLKECGYSEPEDKIMEGPVSVTYGFEDEIMPVKKIYEFSKQMEGLKILGGYMNKRLMSYNEIIELAQIPSKEELYAKFLGIISAPLKNFASALNNPLSSFARVCKAYSETVLDKK